MLGVYTVNVSVVARLILAHYRCYSTALPAIVTQTFTNQNVYFLICTTHTGVLFVAYYKHWCRFNDEYMCST